MIWKYKDGCYTHKNIVIDLTSFDTPTLVVFGTKSPDGIDYIKGFEKLSDAFQEAKRLKMSIETSGTVPGTSNPSSENRE